MQNVAEHRICYSSPCERHETYYLVDLVRDVHKLRDSSLSQFPYERYVRCSTLVCHRCPPSKYRADTLHMHLEISLLPSDMLYGGYKSKTNSLRLIEFMGNWGKPFVHITNIATVIKTFGYENNTMKINRKNDLKFKIFAIFEYRYFRSATHHMQRR